MAKIEVKYTICFQPFQYSDPEAASGSVKTSVFQRVQQVFDVFPAIFASNTKFLCNGTVGTHQLHLYHNVLISKRVTIIMCTKHQLIVDFNDESLMLRLRELPLPTCPNHFRIFVINLIYFIGRHVIDRYSISSYVFEHSGYCTALLHSPYPLYKLISCQS